MAAKAGRGLCTDCGVSRTASDNACGHACQFIQSDYPWLEAEVHGRARDPERGDERFLGPYRRMPKAALLPPRDGARWTGVATRIGERLLATKTIDAVLTMAQDTADRWRPVPVIVTDPAGLAECRGMRISYALLLALLEPAPAAGFKRLAVIGIPCQA